MIGDKAVDVELGRRLGGRSVLVLTGEGTATAEGLSAEARPDYIARGVYDAVQWLVFGACP
jgi:phosphoglycolate phosphatase-like HAD superfamily hydrolase